MSRPRVRLARGSQFGAQAKTDDVAYQAADLFLTASRFEHEGQTISSQLPSLQNVVESMTLPSTKAAELPLELKRARVNLACLNSA